jgi:hypothetical protein
MKMSMTQRLVFGFVLGLSAMFVAAEVTPAQAREQGPWCLRMPEFGGALECSYFTLRQCHTARIGVGGDCVVNPWFGPGLPADEELVEYRPRRKKVRGDAR